MIPYKSVAAALIFSVVLGPIGLLYSSVWGGILMMSVMTYVALNKFYFVTFLCWLFCCILSVSAVESWNETIRQQNAQTNYSS